MSSPSSPSPSKTSDNMRLPAYRASYLSRYHPYPRTRAPMREVVMYMAETGPSEDGGVAENKTWMTYGQKSTPFPSLADMMISISDSGSDFNGVYWQLLNLPYFMKVFGIRRPP
ncbi:hypothetical protein B0F90DRAFT_1814189 [Multifurca ochricompacta]|uniref:Uncharacterized protein n=1 Tax=Multifurca ochricompacta TaxID=376703 RepID=A0AAD4QRF5_9AGAM|nr:hypothetical protein B0F90DRAFT_1814189 [Multifurca ochricompacta]